MKKIFLIAVLLVSVGAHAQIGAVFGFGPQSTSMGATSIQQGRPNPFNVYAAPGMLGFLRDVQVTAGAQYMATDIKPFGTVVLNDRGTLGEFKTAGVLDGGGNLLGIGIPIGKERPLTIGASFYIPFSSLIRVTGNPLNHPFYPLYTDISRNLFFVVGAGYEIARGWGFGVNVRSTTKSVVSYLVRSDNSVNYTASATEARSKSRLSYSLVYNRERINPESQWSIGAMHRAKSALETKISADVTVGVPIQGQLTSMPSYTPAEWALMWTAKTGKFLFSADVTYVIWKGYEAPYGSGNINSYAVGDVQPPANFKNIFVPKVGMEYRGHFGGETLKEFAFRLGYFYHPSPVPDQTGDSNFVDNTRHVGTTGLGLGFQNPWRENDLIEFDLFGQYNHLVTRKVTKTSATKVGAPGYTTGGKIYLAGAAATLRF